MKSKPPDPNAQKKKITMDTDMRPLNDEWYLHEEINVSNRINREGILNTSRSQTLQRTQMWPVTGGQIISNRDCTAQLSMHTYTAK